MVTPGVKSAIKRNKRVYCKWKSRGRKQEERNHVNQIQNETHQIIQEAKDKYHNDLGDKICDARNVQKIIWTAFNRLLNKKKISNIPPLVKDNNFVTNFTSKARIFNTYFAEQCRPLTNDSALPNVEYKTNNKLNNIHITHNSITSRINKLNSKKAHGADNISISMLKLCAVEVSIPLKIIFDKCLYCGKFPNLWKKANVQPVHKKGSMQCKKQYRPISLLSICSKIFEKIIFDQMYLYLVMNNL